MMPGQTFAEQLAENVMTPATGHDDSMSPSAPMSSFGLQFRLANGLWPKLRCALGFSILPTEADAESLPLPSSLSFLYYPYRPMRLAMKYGARLLRHQ
jgi:hypothetical protein